MNSHNMAEHTRQFHSFQQPLLEPRRGLNPGWWGNKDKQAGLVTSVGAHSRQEEDHGHGYSAIRQAESGA